MKPIEPGRRLFLQTMGGVAGATWLNAQLPFIAAAAQHAHEAVQAGHPAHFDVLTPAEATEVSAISARIIPTDDQPGATEAGAVYFIDRALKTFASEYQPIYKAGLVQINLDISKMFPAMKLFSAATVEQQDQLLAEISKAQKPMTRVRRDVIGTTSDFFPIILTHTMMGFLAAPEAGGNFDYVGWKVIGRDPDHTFSPPFGYYDKNYPGWQPTPPPEAEKK
jgi:gluconate 2-dehydrogenase gamma chain